MKRRLCIVITLLTMVVTTLFAKQPFIRVNGYQVSKQVTSIEMEGNLLSLHWNDHTVVRGRLAELMFSLVSRDCVDKARILSVYGVQGTTLRIEGLTPGFTYSVYDLMGNCVMSKLVDSPTIDVDISKLTTGIYLLKCQNIILKFVKG